MNDARWLRQLRRDAQDAALPPDMEGEDKPLPEEFIEAWQADYNAETARAVEFAHLLIAGKLNSRLSDRGIADKVRRFIAEAQAAGDPAAFTRLFHEVKEHVRLPDIVRACYVRLHLHSRDPVTKKALREFVKAKCGAIGYFPIPGDPDLRKVEIAIGLGNLPAKGKGGRPRDPDI
jgi:hypothetical protein